MGILIEEGGHNFIKNIWPYAANVTMKTGPLKTPCLHNSWEILTIAMLANMATNTWF